MRDKRFIVVLVCAMGFGLIAALLVSRYLSKVKSGTGDIVVAKVNIPLSSKITADQLTVLPLPNNATPEGAFTSPEKLIGRVTLTSIAAREAVTEAKLAAQGTDAGLPAMIAEGCRAMTVKVDDVVGVAGFVTPGAWVDIVAVVSPTDRGTNQGPTSKIVLQHIKVLASDQNFDNQKKDSGVLNVKAVTLEVTPEQAEKLALASAEGKLQLVMRNTVDKNDVQTPGANKQSLMTGERVANVPEPAPTPSRSTARRSPGATATPGPARARRGPPPPLSLSTEIKIPAAEPAKPVPTQKGVEMYEGMKRQTVVVP